MGFQGDRKETDGRPRGSPLLYPFALHCVKAPFLWGCGSQSRTAYSRPGSPFTPIALVLARGLNLTPIEEEEK